MAATARASAGTWQSPLTARVRRLLAARGDPPARVSAARQGVRAKKADPGICSTPEREPAGLPLSL
jgi:hypothetical protein